MIVPTVSMAQRWRPEALLGLSAGCEDAARALTASVDDAAAEAGRSVDYWTGGMLVGEVPHRQQRYVDHRERRRQRRVPVAH
ncbi:hypothetical protein, partial [Mycobacterium sp. NAZ190054]|uniref:hypothetical protein n=1 Tax=Mycobacterium sp. NAZ190054 TaxID=1747766 RepID=UPI00079819A5